MKNRFLLILALLAVSMTEVYAISDAKFQKAAAKKVWTERNDIFDASVDIPDSISDGASAVFIADYYRVMAQYETVRNLHRETTRTRRTRWNRRMVKLYDNKAIEDFSEHEFGNRVRLAAERYTFGGADNAFGARIHKPDGRVVDVDLSEAVAVTEGKKDREKDAASKKVAIPGLEPGDVLEYFDYNEEWVDEYDLPSVNIIPFDKYGVMRLVIDAEFSPEITAEFHCYNDFKVPERGKTAKGNNTLSLDLRNIGTLTDKIYLKELRQLPFLSISTLNNTSPYRFYPESLRPGGLYGNVAPGTIYRDIKNAIISLRYEDDLTKKVKKIFGEYRKQHPEADSRQLADACWLAAVYANSTDPEGGYSDFAMAVMMAELMNKLKIADEEAVIAFVNSRNSVSTKEIMSWRQPDYGVFLNGVLYLPDGIRYMAPGEVSGDYQGEEGASFPGNRASITATTMPTLFTVPVSRSNNNRFIMTATVDVNVEDAVAKAELTFTATGAAKYIPGALIDKNTWAQHVEDYLGIPDKQRYSDKSVDSEALRKALDEGYKEFFHVVVSPDASADSVTVVSPGSVPSAAQTVIDAVVSVDGCVVDAGNDVLLNVGKFFADNTRIEGKERERQLDVFETSPLQISYDITFRIPEGYFADEESLEPVKKTVSNKYGSFHSGAELTENGDVRVRVNERYNTYVIPVDDWESKLQIMDASASFNDAAIVLKKR